MPTPFYHLSVAEALLVHPEVGTRTRQLLKEQRGAFLFGNTAPDVQVVSGQTRQATHFFDLPLQKEAAPPWQAILAQHPVLARSTRLPAAQAAFLAGYLCHLQADWLWVKEIFVPAFGLRSPWGTFSERLYKHNVLRAYLDRQILPGLPADIGIHLQQVRPDGWLPFVCDQHLCAWRDLLHPQLQPGAAVQTVEVFASRQGIAPVEYYRLLDSEALLEQEIFIHMPREQLAAYRQRLLAQSAQLLEAYLARPAQSKAWFPAAEVQLQ